MAFLSTHSDVNDFGVFEDRWIGDAQLVGEYSQEVSREQEQGFNI